MTLSITTFNITTFGITTRTNTTFGITTRNKYNIEHNYTQLNEKNVTLIIITDSIMIPC